MAPGWRLPRLGRVMGEETKLTEGLKVGAGVTARGVLGAWAAAGRFGTIGPTSQAKKALIADREGLQLGVC